MKLDLKGIQDKAHNSSGASDIVNMRYDNNAWVPIGTPEKVKELTFWGAYQGSHWHIHKVRTPDGEQKWYWCVYSNMLLAWTEGMEAAKIMVLNPGEVYNFTNAGNAVVVSTNKGGFTFVFDNQKNEYKKIVELPKVKFWTEDIEQEKCEPSYNTINIDTEKQILFILNAIKAAVASMYNKGKVQGHTVFMVGYKTIFGDVIGCTPLAYRYIGSSEKTDDKDSDITDMVSRFGYTDHVSTGTGLSVAIDNIAGFFCKQRVHIAVPNLLALRDSDIVHSLCVFASKPISDINYDCSKDDLFYHTIIEHSDGRTENIVTLPNSEDFEIEKISAMYCVKEVLFEEIEANMSFDLDLTGIESNEAVTEFSQGHNEHSRVMKIYNQRIHAADISVRFADMGSCSGSEHEDSYILPYHLKESDCVGVNFNDVYAYVYLKTSDGDRTVLNKIDERWAVYNGDELVLNPIISYYDSRAYGVRILVKHSGRYHDISGMIPLKEHPFFNMAYNAECIKYIGSFEFTYGTTMSVNLFERSFRVYRSKYLKRDINIDNEFAVRPNRFIRETNRLQVYAQNGGLYGGKAKWSYRFGDANTIIRGMGANVISLGASQFGQYPLMVMSSDGVHALLQGDGDVLYSAIHPVGYDVMTHGNVINTRYGLVFNAVRGLVLQQGGDAILLSENIDGTFENVLENETVFIKNINGSNLVSNVPDSLFREGSQYERIIGDKMGYDYKRDELYINTRLEDDDNREYCFVLNMKHRYWSKIGVRFDDFFNDDGNLCGLIKNKVCNLSEKGTGNEKGFVYITNPIRLDVDETKIHNIRVLYKDMRPRGNQTSHKLSVQLWASQNGHDWKMIAGKRFRQTSYIELKNVKLSATYHKIAIAARHNDIQLIGVDVKLR